MLWSDLTYDDETGHPFGTARPADKNAADASLIAYYKKLIGIRNGSEALRTGGFETLLTDDSNGVYAFARSAGGTRTVVVINHSSSRKRVTVPLPGEPVSGGWINLLDSLRVSSVQGDLGVELPPESGAILEPVR
jgi:glycosidase